METVIITAIADLATKGMDLIALSQQKGLMKLDLRIKESLAYKQIFNKEDKSFKIQLMLLALVSVFFIIALVIKSKKR